MIPAHGDETTLAVHHDGKPKRNCWKSFIDWMKLKDKDKWLEKMQQMLALVSTLIATMTFQVALNPPGGVLQAEEAEEVTICANDPNQTSGCPGEAVLAISYTDNYYYFQIFNTISFIASLSITLLLVSGIPLDNKFQMWLSSMGMIITLSSLALTYLYGMLLVTPSAPGPWRNSTKIVRRVIRIWIILVGLMTLFLTIRFLVWLVRKSIKKYNRRKSTTTT